MSELLRKAWVEVDLDAIRANVATLARIAQPAELCVAVKADAYGHGALQVATVALQAGATRLGVATTEEGMELRQAGIDVPILVLGEPHPDAMEAVARHHLTPALYSLRGIEAAALAAENNPLFVHLKVDTGMHRSGAPMEEVNALLKVIGNEPSLHLEGLFTHFAVADEPTDPLTQLQAERFRQVIRRAADSGYAPPLIHCANSATTLLHSDLHMGMVRCGIALYGLVPSTEVPIPAPMRPALTIKAKVGFVRRVPAGEGISYGQAYVLSRDANIATIPMGYADGVPRPLGTSGGEVLINGKRYPIAGNITMDQLMADCGDDPVQVDDEVVVIGTQGNETIHAHEIAAKLGTINYEITTRIGSRLARIYKGGGTNI